MADTKEYLSVYRHFFEEFARTVNPDDQLPVKVGGYYLCDTELIGEIVDWTLQYLSQKHCPSSLLAPLTRIVIEEIKSACKKRPEACGYRTIDNTYQPLKLMQLVTGKVNEVCLRYHDNGKLASLPPPSPGPPISSCAIKNSRRRMEDRHVIIEDFHAVFNIQDRNPASFYAVFDGHAGTDAAMYSVSHLHQFLAESPYYPTDPERALRDAFIRTDAMFLEKSNRENLRSGTTAVCALLCHKEKMLYVAWLGDSQALLVRQGRAVQVVNPHKPDRQDERERIENMGGCVLYWGTWRVNGQLAVSRAIGDLDYKPYVTSEPDLKAVPLDGTEDFLVVACDGLWDFVSEEDAVQAVYQQIRKAPGDLEAVSEKLVQLSKEQGSTDNISVIVVFLTDPVQLASRPVDVWEHLSKHQAPSNTMDTSNNPFASDSVPFQKPGLLLDLGAGGDVFKQNGTSPSANDLYFLDRPANGKGNFDDDDFGPETDVDAVDDVLLSPSKVAHSPRNNNPFEEKLFEDDEMEKKAFEQLIANVGQEKNEFDPMKDTRQETPTPPAGEGNLFKEKPLEEKAETDLDAVDDVLLSPSKDASSLRNNNPFEEKLLEDDELEKRAVEQLIANVKQGKDESEPVVEESKEETSKPSADEVACFTNLVLEPDNVAESGEESEDEWNYYRVEPTAETADTNQQSTEQICEKSAQQLEEEENMESQLNPNAKEFVPSPTQLIPPAQDILIAESPKNGTTVENISLPTHLEFQHEVSQRPSELDLTDEPKQKVAGKLPDLISSEEGGDAKTFPPPGAICGKSIEHLENGMFKDFLDQGDRNFQELQSSNLQSSLGLGLDESEVSSTKAEFGDDSNMSFMTSELQKTFSENVSCVAGVEKSFSEHELLGSEFTSDIISSDGSEPPEFNGSEIYKKLGTVEVSSSNVTVVERDPLSLSFEIEKQLVPEMESKPERVQLESEGTSSFEQDDSGSPIRTVAMGEVSDVKVFTDLEAPVEEEQVPYKVDLSDEVSNIKQSELSLPDIDNAPSLPKPSEDEQPSSSPVSPKLSAPHLEDGALEPKSSISEDAFSPIQETSPKPSQSPPLSPVLSNKSLQSPPQSPLLSKPELSPLHSQDLLQEFEASPKSPLLAQEPHSPPKSPLLETSVPVEQQIVLAQEPHSPPKSPLLETSVPVEQQIESPQSPLLSKSPVWEASSPLPSAADTALSTPETVPVGKDGTPSPLLETKSPVDFSVLVETDLQTLQEKGIEKEEHFSSVTPDKEQPSQVSTSELDIMDVRYPTDSLAADFSLEENQIQPSDFSVKPIEDDSVTQVPPPTPAHLSEDLLNADIETLEEKLDLSTEKADAVSEKMDLEKEKTEEKKEEIPVVGAAVVGGTVAAVAAAVGVVKATDEKFADKKPAATEAKKSPTPKDKKGPIPDKTKATKTTTPKAAVPTTAKLSQKSTPTSPTKPLTTTARTSTPKKPLTPTTTSLTSKATKSPAASTAKPKPTPPLTSKTTPSTTKTSTTKPVTASPRPKPPSTTTASKSAVLTNGDASKPAAIRKPGTITAAKPPSRPATAPATTKTTTKQVTSVTSRTTTNAPRPKPGAVNGTTTKPRTTGTVAPATARSKVTMARDTKQVTDKQVKETANKQISSSRSLTATKSATTTTAKRVSGVTKTSMSVTNTAKSATTKTAVKKTMATATSKTTTKTQVTVTATATENNELVQVQPVVD